MYDDDVPRPEDGPAARLRLRLGPAAGHGRALDGGRLGQGSQPVRTQEPGRRPPAGHRGGRARVPGQPGLRPAHPVGPAGTAGLPGQPVFAAYAVGAAAAGRDPAPQPRPGQDLPAAGPLRPVLPVRRAPRPGHRPGRRPSGADPRADRGPAARHPDNERPARLPGPGAGADPRALPRPGYLQHGAAVEQRVHRGRGAEHPERVQPVRRAQGDRAVPLPGGVAAGLCRPQRLRRRSPLRQRAAVRPARPGVRRDQALPDR